LRREHGYDAYDNLRAELDALCADYIVGALRALGFDFREGERVSEEDLFARSSVAGRYRALFGRLIDILAEDGILAREDGAVAVKRRPGTAQPEARIEALRAKFPAYWAELALTARCAGSLGAVLKGEADPLHLLFPDGSAETVEAIYSQSPGTLVFNRVAAEATASEAARRSGALRVLEVGAGTGGTTVHVAPVLPAGRTEYVFTDVSSYFRARAAERFRQHPFIRYGTLDIESDPAEQGFQNGQFDIVIAANVLHATADLRETLGHVRGLLRPGGAAIIVEGTHPERWVDLTFGLTEGWWRFRDRDLRRAYPLISRDAWLSILAEAGFEDAAAIQPPEGSQQAVFLARNSGDALAPSASAGSPRADARSAAKARAVAPDPERLRGASPEERIAAIRHYLIDAVAAIASLESAAIDPGRPVTDCGLDSLMALEFKNRIGADLGIAVSTVRILKAPTIQELAREIAASLPEPREPERPAEAAPPASEFPLSYGQQAQWFAHKFMPDSPTFNVAFTVRAAPPLAWESFQRALAKLVARHPSLRTVFVENDQGRPVQRVLPSATPDAVLIDAGGWSEVELRESLAREFTRTFALDKPPLRITVFRCAASDVILFNVDHLIVDASSLHICFADLKRFYAAELAGACERLEPLGEEYREFVEWEAAIAQSPEGERLWGYWSRQLAGDLPELNLPVLHERPAVLVAQGDFVGVPFRPGLLAAVQRVARDYQTTAYAFLLAAYGALLRRYTRQEDVIVGTTASMRQKPEWAGAVGYFVNLLPLRMKMEGNPTFVEHVVRTRDTVLGAIEHQDYPFSLIVSRLRLRRSLDRSPVFQAFFNFLANRSGELGPLIAGTGGPPVPFGGSMLTPYMAIPQQEGQSEIVLRLAEVDGELAGSLSYNSAILDRSTAEAMAQNYRSMVDALIRDPQMRIDDLPFSGLEPREMENLVL
jgi:SAM-dependent methyltransferase/aryl carrier-like protein